jgi:hypothetical protein
MESFISRWGQEVTFREAREHLGIETQRQWSDPQLLVQRQSYLAYTQLLS